MILQAKKMVFVTDPDESNSYIEFLRTEYCTNQYVIKIDQTMKPSYYQLFHVWKEGKRTLTRHLFSSSKLDKIVEYIDENIQ